MRHTEQSSVLPGASCSALYFMTGNYTQRGRTKVQYMCVYIMCNMPATDLNVSRYNTLTCIYDGFCMLYTIIRWLPLAGYKLPI